MTITIDATHNGPPQSGHGGVTGGRLAELAGGRGGTVRYHAPIPLETPLEAVVDGDIVALTLDAERIVSFRRRGGEPLSVDLPVVPHETARLAERGYLAAQDGVHPCPTCFVCGDVRDDGPRLRPGRVDGTSCYAATWTPTFEPGSACWMTWAVLDCASGAPALGEVPEGTAVITGELTVDIERLPLAGEEHVVVSRLSSIDGRRHFTEAAVLDASGAAIAAATATWFAIDVTALLLDADAA